MPKAEINVVVLDRFPLHLYMRITGDMPKRPNQMLGRGTFTARNNAKTWKSRGAKALAWLKPEAPLEKVQITVIRHSSNMCDYDGVVGQMKPLIDAFVEAGILADDGWKNTGPWQVDQKYRPRKEGPLIEIWIKARS